MYLVLCDLPPLHPLGESSQNGRLTPDERLEPSRANRLLQLKSQLAFRLDAMLRRLGSCMHLYRKDPPLRRNKDRHQQIKDLWQVQARSNVSTGPKNGICVPKNEMGASFEQVGQNKLPFGISDSIPRGSGDTRQNRIDA